MESSVLLVFVSWTALLIHLTYGEGEEQTWLNFFSSVFICSWYSIFEAIGLQNCEYINELIEFIMSYPEKFRIPNKFTLFDLLMTECFQARFFVFKWNLSFPIQKKFKNKKQNKPDKLGLVTKAT